MRILATSPGKFGDLLWALPTVRALAETYETPVDLLIASGFGSLIPLLTQQPYLGTVTEDPTWVTQDTAPRTPRVPPDTARLIRYDQVYPLGYDGWPSRRLAEQVYHQSLGRRALAPLDLTRPWITVPAEAIAALREPRRHLVIGFSEEWIELKVGVTLALKRTLKTAFGTRWCVDVIKPPGPTRWDEWTFRDGVYATEQPWTSAAALIAGADLFLGCLSAPWVLANALGIPTVVCEPSKMRWDSPGGWTESIFWRPSARNTMVLGTDGLPTFDARAVGAAVVERLSTVPEEGTV